MFLFLHNRREHGKQAISATELESALRMFGIHHWEDQRDHLAVISAADTKYRVEVVPKFKPKE